MKCMRDSCSAFLFYQGCAFSSEEKTVNNLLPHIITHEILNGNGPWELRAAFFHNIVGVSAFVGIDDLEKYILPCIEHALSGMIITLPQQSQANTHTADEEEFVIDKAVNCIASLCELGMFRKQVIIVPFTPPPSPNPLCLMT